MYPIEHVRSGGAAAGRAALGAVVGAMLLAQAGLAGAAELPGSFADLAEKVTPAVVNVSSEHPLEVGDGQGVPGLPFRFPEGSPFEEFFRQFREQYGHGQQGQHPRVPKAAALGSGFIIDPTGYVVTNNHVIEGASGIQVTLTSGKEYDAELIGTDPQTDLALLKIEADEPLPAVAWGDSDKARVGDWVIAVGNPFGLGGTVTTGIVSARGRDINAGPYDDFLQIDAAINQGNSGGPTFDTEGQVIGVNTAIASPNGGSVGIGFAVPSNIAKTVIAQLREDGSVERGWLGVQIQPVTPEIAAALGVDEAKGALVAGVQPGSPAAGADLRQGDVILQFGGKAIGEMRELPRLVAATPAGEKAELVIWRDGREETIRVEVGKLQPSEQVATAEPAAPAAPSSTSSSEALGLTLSAVTPELRQQFGLAEEVEGVVIVDVDPDGPAAAQGLRPGDVIEKVAQTAVSTPAEVEAATKDAKQDTVLLLVNRRGTPQFVAVEMRSA